MTIAPGSTDLTIYNGGFALVKENRKLNLVKGVQTVAIEDVAAMIDPASVGFRSLTDKASIRVLDQNYQYDLISPLAILNKSVGHRIRFVRTVANQKEVLEGVLISAPTAVVGNMQGGNDQTYNGMVIRTDDGRIVLNPTGEIEVSSVPNGLISKPTLVWNLESTTAGPNNVELSYLTNGITWRSDYVMVLGIGSKADLQGWVTLDNQSGATYTEAKLKLLAGDVNRIQEPRSYGRGGGGMAVMDAAKSQFQEQSLFEYHLYTLDRPATVRNRETKQLSLLEGHDVPFHKRLIFDALQDMGRFNPSEGEVGTGDLKAQVRVEFANDTSSGLGMPLPAGKFKIYQRDSDGSVQLLGEDQIQHTPRNEKVSLIVGRSFDVVATRLRTNFTRVSDRVVRESFQIEVRNRKETAENIEILERHWWDWKILDKSQDFLKLDANTMRFEVSLPPNGVKKVTYTVETRW